MLDTSVGTTGANKEWDWGWCAEIQPLSSGSAEPGDVVAPGIGSSFFKLGANISQIHILTR